MAAAYAEESPDSIEGECRVMPGGAGFSIVVTGTRESVTENTPPDFQVRLKR